MTNIAKEIYLANKDVFNVNQDEIVCGICLDILISPRQCNSCENNFCTKCFIGKCPYRCKDSETKESSRLLKNLLSKLKFECEKCLNIVDYDRAINHTCVFDTNCPLCFSGKITTINRIKFYEDKILKPVVEENIRLKNEIENYKELIAKSNQYINANQKKDIDINAFNYQAIEIENDLFPLKWDTKDKNKDSFILSNNNKTITIDFDGCWNCYYLNDVFNSDTIVTFKLKIKAFPKSDFSFHYIGFLNDNYGFDFECMCLSPKNAFYLHNEGTQLKEGSTVLLTNRKLEMLLDVENTLKFSIQGSTGNLKVYKDEAFIGEIIMSGKNFRFFVGKCNKGKIMYTLSD